MNNPFRLPSVAVLRLPKPDGVLYCGKRRRAGGTSYRALLAIFGRKGVPVPVTVADFIKEVWNLAESEVKANTVRQCVWRANIVLTAVGHPLRLALDGRRIFAK